MNILITGAAGFIGFHLSKRLLERGFHVTGLDNLKDTYDVPLKQDRIAAVHGHPSFVFQRLDLNETDKIEELIKEHQIHTVIHLAAQTGVRSSLENPQLYIDSNIKGFTNLLEACRKHSVRHFIYASSSSVYGANTSMPFSTKDHVDHPVSIYAVTKRTNELLAHTYSHLYGLPTTGLRFFTVYGPWGRPDMAYFSFTRKIHEGSSVKLFNYGEMKRDFTYIDDVVTAIERLIGRIPQRNDQWDRSRPCPDTSYAPYRIYNIGSNRPVSLLSFVRILEELLGKKAVLELLPMQPGDVYETCADIGPLQEEIGFTPETPVETGLKRFVAWYLDYSGEKLGGRL